MYSVLQTDRAVNADPNDGGPWKRFERLFKRDLKLTLLTAGYFSSVFTFVGLYIIDAYNNVSYGNRANMNTFYFVRNLLLFLPFVLNCHFFEYLPTIEP